MSDSHTTQARRVALSGFLGTSIEYYDFLVYGTLATLLFNQIFFDNLSPLLGTIAALATLAAGYVARFAGAVVFGHFGDRIGRKSALMTTLIVMGIASGLIGLLPTQEQVGVAAPLMLLALRLVQGIAVGGEYGGAVLMTAEHAPAGRRGLTTSATIVGAPVGSTLATGTVLLLTAVLTEEQLISWGWRIPFVLSFALLGVGLYVRRRIVESPVFEEHKSGTEEAPAPFLEVIRSHPRALLTGTALQLAALSGQGVFAIYVLSYATGMGYSRSTVLTAVLVGTIASMATTPLFASLSDRIGRRPVCFAGSAAATVLAFPLFWMIDLGNPGLLIPCLALYICLVMTSVTSVAPVLLSEIFPTHVRYTGVSTAYQLAVTIGSGLVPLAAASLVAAAGGSGYLVATMLVVIGLVSLLALRAVPETAGNSFTTKGVSAPVHSADIVASES